MQTEELSLDGIPYELRAYSADGEQFTSEWRCKECDETDGVLIFVESLEDALDLARFSLFAHHQISHSEVSQCKPLVPS